MNILITGASGFVGSSLVRALKKMSLHQLTLIAGVNSKADRQDIYHVRDLSEQFDWSDLLAGQQVVIHVAARSRVVDPASKYEMNSLRRVNTEGTLRLAQQAAAAGVKRFVFISSIKVNGDSTLLGRPFRVIDRPAPEDAYGVSKWEAEKGLISLAATSEMEYVIIRPPLVYGEGVKGNFGSLVKLVASGLPLPFAAVKNLRSMVSIDNLSDLILTCLDHPAAANRVFLVSDGEDLSTPELLRRLAHAMRMPSRLFFVPSSMLLWAARVLNKRQIADRLMGSLQVDISETCDLLEWSPPSSVMMSFSQMFEGNK